MQRLKTRAQFQAVLAAPVVSRTAHFVLHRAELVSLAPCSTDQSPAFAPRALLPQPQVHWMGALIPKRWARRAVTRNSIRRQIYAVSSGLALRAPASAHVVRLRASFDRRQFVSASSEALKHAVRQELSQLFGRVSVPAPAEVRG